jgi:guanyl-specific ribonuclease Sa
MSRLLAIPSCNSRVLLRRLSLLAAVFLAGASAWSQSARAADDKSLSSSSVDAADSKKSSKKSSQKVSAPKVRSLGSGETPAERAARLKRECKGMPNAGACTGYTH